jgi:hypothetical protein
MSEKVGGERVVDNRSRCASFFPLITRTSRTEPVADTYSPLYDTGYEVQ